MLVNESRQLPRWKATDN